MIYKDEIVKQLSSIIQKSKNQNQIGIGIGIFLQ